MKLVSIFLLSTGIIMGVIWFLKINNTDNKARKEATAITAHIEKLRCKQNLKSDKSLIVVSYKGNSYSIFTSQKKCASYQTGQEIHAYFSPTYNRLFLEL